MVREIRIRRRRLSIGADCKDCMWQAFGDTAPLARKHTRDTGHTTYFTVEETVVCTGGSDDENPAL